jgi:hypothetical protein
VASDLGLHIEAVARLVPRLDPLIRRLASDHDGERLATVEALERVLAAGGCDFHHLADVLGAAPVVMVSPRPSPGRATWADLLAMASELDEHPDLSPWESSFVANVRRTLRRGLPLSAKQRRTLERRIWEERVGNGVAT